MASVNKFVPSPDMMAYTRRNIMPAAALVVLATVGGGLIVLSLINMHDKNADSSTDGGEQHRKSIARNDQAVASEDASNGLHMANSEPPISGGSGRADHESRHTDDQKADNLGGHKTPMPSPTQPAIPSLASANRSVPKQPLSGKPTPKQPKASEPTPGQPKTSESTPG